MSVYTSVDFEQLEHFLLRYDLGKAIAFKAVAAGITNSNYTLETDQGRFVLTLYEHHSDDELDYMLSLQRHLVKRAVRCAQPAKDRRGEFYSSLNNRPAAIIHLLPGEVQSRPNIEHCALIGAELGKFHLAGEDFEAVRANPRGLDWIVAVRDMLQEYLDDVDQAAIESSLLAARNFDLDSLPRGAIHADLFHDNALFVGEVLGGILDFDYACTDCYVLDIAVLLNDWCIDQDYQLIDTRVSAVIDGYQQQRCLEPAEIEALPLMLRLTALRFWLSRLYDKTFPLCGELTFTKCPDQFREMHRLRGIGAYLPDNLHRPRQRA
ncbi:MAG: homoserine kinase [Gammaproteobacteria bacterium]|jgi:homoserine kinase type II|nr:homoserine kinase [Gammaproteobacteria bacterium]